MTTLLQLIEERDHAREEAHALRAILKSMFDDAYACPGETARFSKLERRLLCVFKKAEGRIINRQSVLDALYFDQGSWPAYEKITDVLVCKIRPKLQSHRIETIWGIGWKLVPLNQDEAA